MIKDRDQLLTTLEECLVISYEYDENAQTFVLITDSMIALPLSDRDFIRITCTGARNFVREPGLYAPVQRFRAAYSLREAAFQVVVQSAEFALRDRGCSVELALGADFGSLSLICSIIETELKSSKATEYEPGKWRYYALETGVEFEFEAPFD